MKIGILSYRPLENRASVEELMLKRQAKSMGHKARILRVKRFQMVYDQDSPWLLYDGKPFQNFDVIITRPSILQNVDLHVSLIEQMEMAGMLLFNKSSAILNAKNKIKTMQILDSYRIPVPKTVFVRRPDDLNQAVKLVGGFPVILKQPVGSFGLGVTIIESMRALKSVLMWDQPMYLLQQYVKYSKGKDIRIFVINGQVVGSMVRAAQKGEFRPNMELGGKGMPVEITDQEKNIALSAVQALSLHYAGVDVMRSKEGSLVLEVNSNPGFKGLQEVTNINIAEKLIKFAVEYAERYKHHVPATINVL